jgi:translation elongation factor P/translation initiation factor 5A
LSPATTNKQTKQNEKPAMETKTFSDKLKLEKTSTARKSTNICELKRKDIK